MSNDNGDEYDSMDMSLEAYIDESLAEIYETMDSEAYMKDAYGYDALLKNYIYTLKSLASKIAPVDSYVISCSGPAYFVSPMSREMVKCERGMEVYPVKEEAEPDKNGNVMVRTQATYLLIPNKQLIKVGFN